MFTEIAPEMHKASKQFRSHSTDGAKSEARDSWHRWSLEASCRPDPDKIWWWIPTACSGASPVLAQLSTESSSLLIWAIFWVKHIPQSRHLHHTLVPQAQRGLPYQEIEIHINTHISIYQVADTAQKLLFLLSHHLSNRSVYLQKAAQLPASSPDSALPLKSFLATPWTLLILQNCSNMEKQHPLKQCLSLVSNS